MRTAIEPEPTWWAFHKLIRYSRLEHQVFAVDLPGFGDSSNEPVNTPAAARPRPCDCCRRIDL